MSALASLRFPRQMLLALLLAAPSILADDLVLKGMGTRKAMFIELYTCEIFGTAEAESIESLLREEFPVRIRLKVHGDTPGAMPEDWKTVVDAELNEQLMRRVQHTYRDLDAGDEVTIEYEPGKETIVSLNGERLFSDPGRGLTASILEQWIGAAPVSESLRAELLGE